MTQQKINIKLLPVKAHYFFFNAAGSTLWPFLPVIGKQMGISAEAIGYVYTVAPITGCVAKPFFGYVADRLKKRKKSFLFFLLLALTSSLALGFLNQSLPQRPVVFECGNFGTNYLIQRNDYPDHIGVEEAEAASLVKIKHKDPNPSQSLEEQNPELSPGEELCHVKCAIQTFIEGSEFCINLKDQLVDEDLPDRCREKPRMRENDTITSDPYTLAFDVVLKMESTALSHGALFLHVDRLSFYPDTGNFSQFSCHPDKARLTTCFVDCPEHPVLNTRLERVIADAELSESSSFWLYGVLVILAFAAFAVATSVGDGLCFQILKDKPQYYGMQRQWGAVGWGIFTLVAGYLVDTNSKGKLLKDYSPCFYLLAVLYIGDLIVAYRWEVEEVEKPKQIRRDLWNLVTDLRVIIFGFACMIVGMCTGMHWNFLFWYIEDLAANDHDVMEWMKVFQGVMVSVQCFSELPFFYFSGWFLRKLGNIHCMTLVLFAFGSRFILYSVLSHPWSFIPVELFQGITFGIFYSLMTSYASAISPPGAASTVQGFVSAIFEGVGIALGSLVGGILMQTWGGSRAYRLFGIAALVFSVIHAVLTFFLSYMAPAYGRTCSQHDEGQEMFSRSKINGVSQEVDAESE